MQVFISVLIRVFAHALVASIIAAGLTACLALDALIADGSGQSSCAVVMMGVFFVVPLAIVAGGAVGFARAIADLL